MVGAQFDLEVVSGPGANGRYLAGEEIDVEVRFSVGMQVDRYASLTQPDKDVAPLLLLYSQDEKRDFNDSTLSRLARLPV